MAASFTFQAPFDHNLRNSEGMTPLMLACRLGRKDFVRFLLESAVYYIQCETCRGIDAVQGNFNKRAYQLTFQGLPTTAPRR